LPLLLKISDGHASAYKSHGNSTFIPKQTFSLRPPKLVWERPSKFTANHRPTIFAGGKSPFSDIYAPHWPIFKRVHIFRASDVASDPFLRPLLPRPGPE
jgi:hypothetical protein